MTFVFSLSLLIILLLWFPLMLAHRYSGQVVFDEDAPCQVTRTAPARVAAAATAAAVAAVQLVQNLHRFTVLHLQHPCRVNVTFHEAFLAIRPITVVDFTELAVAVVVECQLVSAAAVAVAGWNRFRAHQLTAQLIRANRKQNKSCIKTINNKKQFA